MEREHLLKLISLYVKGEEIFGDIDALHSWLQKPSWNAKEKFIDLLNTPEGIDLVAAEIERLACGYAV